MMIVPRILGIFIFSRRSTPGSNAVEITSAKRSIEIVSLIKYAANTAPPTIRTRNRLLQEMSSLIRSITYILRYFQRLLQILFLPNRPNHSQVQFIVCEDIIGDFLHLFCANFLDVSHFLLGCQHFASEQLLKAVE